MTQIAGTLAPDLAFTGHVKKGETGPDGNAAYAAVGCSSDGREWFRAEISSAVNQCEFEEE